MYILCLCLLNFLFIFRSFSIFLKDILTALLLLEEKKKKELQLKQQFNFDSCPTTSTSTRNEMKRNETKTIARIIQNFK